MNASSLILVTACACLGAGCASTMSGLGGSASYACKAPEGVLCTSVSGVYANSIQNNLPSQRIEKRRSDSPEKVVAVARPTPSVNPAPDAASIRSAPRVLRLWIAPWEDSDGDLEDESYIYVVVDTGHWLIEHKRAAIRDEFTPIAAPNPPPQAANDARETTSSSTASPPPPRAQTMAPLQQPGLDSDVEPARR